MAISNLGSAGGSLLAGCKHTLSFIVHSATYTSLSLSTFIGLSDQFSRKYGILVGGLVMAVGSAILASSYYIW